MQIKGNSYYSTTTKKNTKGKYPSNCYEVGLTDIDLSNVTDEDELEQVEKFISEHQKEVDVKEDGKVIGTTSALKIANSKYEIPMFDMNANRLENAVPLANGTPINIEVEIKHSDKFNTDYMTVKAIQVLEPIKEFNPFK